MSRMGGGGGGGGGGGLQLPLIGALSGDERLLANLQWQKATSLSR